MKKNSSHPLVRVRLVEARKRRGWSQEQMAHLLGTTRLNVSRWERAITTPTLYFREKLTMLLEISAQDLLQTRSAPKRTSQEEEALSSEQAASMKAWNVPFQRNPFFTGREQLLQQLHAGLSQRQGLSLTSSYALSGLGGIGKTQTAIEYAYRYNQAYSAVFWVLAETPDSLLAGLASLAEILGLTENGATDQQQSVKAVKHWLSTHQDWLLILDNLKDAALLQSVLSPVAHGSLLLTTCMQALGSFAQCLEVEQMSLEEGVRFLLLRSKRMALQDSCASVAPDEYEAARALVTAMGGLPLALDQAGGYIDEMGYTLSAYLHLYRSQRKALLHRRGHLSGDHPESVATTWDLSFAKIEQTSPAVAAVLRLCAFLDPDAIPEELLSEGGAYLDTSTGPLAMETLALNDAIQHLRKFSLIQRAPDAGTLRLHLLVQVVLKDAMERGEQRQWAERAVRATNATFPATVEMSTWPRCRRYLPQAQACSVLIQDYAFIFPEAAALLYRTACYFEDFAHYAQAEPLLQQAIAIREQAPGLQYPETLRIMETMPGIS